MRTGDQFFPSLSRLSTDMVYGQYTHHGSAGGAEISTLDLQPLGAKHANHQRTGRNKSNQGKVR